MSVSGREYQINGSCIELRHSSPCKQERLTCKPMHQSIRMALRLSAAAHTGGYLPLRRVILRMSAFPPSDVPREEHGRLVDDGVDALDQVDEYFVL